SKSSEVDQMTFRPKIAALLGCALALGGCASPAEQWIPAAEAPKVNKVELARLSHPVRFSAGSATLAPGEADRLAGFLDKAEVSPGPNPIVIPAAAEALPPARQAALRRALVRRGLRPTFLPAGTAPAVGQTPAPDTASLVVERYVVTPPDCP